MASTRASLVPLQKQLGCVYTELWNGSVWNHSVQVRIGASRLHDVLEPFCAEPFLSMHSHMNSSRQQPNETHVIRSLT